MKVTFLGTGTSQGVPVISCNCDVCQSSDPKDTRLRTSIMINEGDLNVVVDAGPDFRQQMLAHQVKSLDAILITHEHNDHVIGLDDIRPFNFITRNKISVYATEHVQNDLKVRFAYIFDENPYPGAPSIEFSKIENNKSIRIEGYEFIPIRVHHGNVEVFGFRLKNFAYITDANRVDPEEKAKLKGVEHLVVNALQRRPHHSHFNLEQAIEFIEEIKPEKAYLTHMGHRMGTHAETNLELPKNIQLAFDGLSLEL